MGKKFVQYGAGNIGRGFIGQLFSQSGYEVVFVDVVSDIVNKLNADRSYPIRIVSDEGAKEVIIENVRAVNGMDMEAVAQEIATADIMATSVGVNILPRIVKPILAGIRRRWEIGNEAPLNIIICENLIDANKYLEELFKKEMSPAECARFDKSVGLVEASIGRMVPVMTPEMQEGNILRVCVEEYSQLPVDKDAFKGEIPAVKDMLPFSPFEFFIRRKLFIHNMGHALTAYLGYLAGDKLISDAIRNPYIRIIVQKAMTESAVALAREFNMPVEEILLHVDDLIFRFGNRMLGDTVARVGRDTARKLAANDRLVGAALLCESLGLKNSAICLGIAAGLLFAPADDAASQKVQGILAEKGLDETLRQVCGLSPDSDIAVKVRTYYTLLKEQRGDIPAVLAALERIEDTERRRR